MGKKILFVEDDKILGTLITQGLKNAGQEVLYLTTLQNFRQQVNSFKPDLVLLDLDVENQNSLDEIPWLKSKYPALIVFVATSYTGGEIVEMALSAHVDYYIKKPYQIKEVLALINRFFSTELTGTQTIGAYHLDCNTHTLFFPGQKEKKLTLKEYLVLCLLWKNKDQIVFKTTILQAIWNNNTATDSLNNCISSLRKALEEDDQLKIENIKGVGYILKVE